MTAPAPTEVSPEVRVTASGVTLYMWRRPECTATRDEIKAGVDKTLRVRSWRYRSVRDGHKGTPTGRQEPDHCMVAMQVDEGATCTDDQFDRLVEEFKHAIDAL